MSSLWKAYKRALQYGEERIREILVQRDELYARTKHNGPYLVQDVITIMTDDLSRAVGGSEENMLESSLAIEFVGLFSEKILQSTTALVFGIVKELEANLPGSIMRLRVLK